MKYQIIAYDYNNGQFKSHQGYESDISLQPEEGYSYYLYRGINKVFIVKLTETWVDNKKIGEIITLQGECIDIIPHPGKPHGQIKTSGLVTGNEKQFKFIVTPFSGNQYFLIYLIDLKTFEEAGITVR